MLFQNLVVSSFIATTIAIANSKANPMPHKLAKMSLNQAFGIVGRQQNGYAPSQTFCGQGNDCPTACGTDTTQCPSNDGGIHCFKPASQKCCHADALGNACDDGYFCTSNAQGTWCCPDGMSLNDCAALYGVSSLVSEVASATSNPISAVTSTDSSIPTTVSKPTYTSPAGIVTGVTKTSLPTGISCPSCAVPQQTSSANGTVTAPEPPLQFENVANHFTYGALPVLVLSVGAIIVM